MTDKDAVTLARHIAAEELCRENWKPGVKAGMYEDIMAGKADDEPLVRIALRALRQPAAEHADAGGLVEHLRAHGFIRDDEAEAAEQCLATLGGSDAE